MCVFVCLHVLRVHVYLSACGFLVTAGCPVWDSQSVTSESVIDIPVGVAVLSYELPLVEPDDATSKDAVRGNSAV